MAELKQTEEMLATEQFISRLLRDLTRPNAIRLKAGLQILMIAEMAHFETITSQAVQQELQDFKTLLLNPERLAPESCRSEAGKSGILQHIKKITLENLSLLDDRPTILPNTYTVLKTVKEGERLKSVVHTSALRNVVTAAHYMDAIEARFRAEGYIDKVLAEKVNLATEAMSKLQAAVLEGDLTTLQKSLSVEGVDVNLPNPEGLPLLHLAIREGHTEVVRLLLTVPHVNVNLVSNNGWAPLHFACRLGWNDIVKILLSAPAIQVNIVNSDGWTPLHWAAWHGFINVVIILLTDGRLEVNKRDSTNCTPLHWAARNGHADVVSVLLADPRIDPNPIDNELKTPLHYAVSFDHVAATSTLLSALTIAINLQDMDGLTPLHWAARNGRSELVDLLIEVSDIRYDLRDHNNMTAADWARRNEYPELVPKLTSKNHKVHFLKKLWEHALTRFKQVWSRE